jgi:hypothetical protein
MSLEHRGTAGRGCSNESKKSLNRYRREHSMKRTVILSAVMWFIMLTVVAFGSQCKPHEFYDGYSELGGWTIGSPYDEKPLYSISYTCKNNVCDRFYLSRFLYHDESGCAYHAAISHVVIPPLKKDQTYALGCTQNGVSDPEIVTYVKATDQEFYTEIIHAWRANRRLEKFEKISTKGIKCSNEGFGE